MKVQNVALLFSLILILIACQKQDTCPKPPVEELLCDLMQSGLDYTYQDETYKFPSYQKAYDWLGRVTQVVAIRYTYEREDSIVFMLAYKGGTVYFLDAEKLTDTVLVASFDAKNRLVKMARGNVDADGSEFLTFKFIYTGNRLSSFIAFKEDEGSLYEYPALLNYDGHGNIVRIYNKGASDSEGHFYTYDLSVTAKHQWYSDDFDGWFYNTFYLAQFMGWLPDLMPVNKRLTSKEVEKESEEDPEPTVLFYNILSDHVYDENGNLLSYKNDSYKYVNTWNCSRKKEVY